MPYTAIVGAGRRLATDAVVINASATQEMCAIAGAFVLAAVVAATRLPAGTSMALIASPDAHERVKRA